MKTIKMLSLDTSTAKTGYGYWENGELIESGYIASVKTENGNKTDDMMKRLKAFIMEKKPQIVVVEMTVVVMNAVTQRELTELIGGLRWHCVNNKIDFHRLRPTQWRKLVKDEDEKLPKKREELKKWAIAKVFKIFGKKVGDDEADAVLIGYAYKKMFEWP